jgi:hypothetical protein
MKIFTDTPEHGAFSKLRSSTAQTTTFLIVTTVRISNSTILVSIFIEKQMEILLSTAKSSHLLLVL